jgi:iron complex transport system ATP-binding protein
MIEFKQTHIGYNHLLIDVADLKLESGKLYTLIGRNGTGKTTLLDTLLGITSPLSGEISINQRNTFQLKLKEKAQLVAYVPSLFAGVQNLCTRDYIAMGRAPYTNFIGKLSSNDWKLVDSIISKLNIGHLAKIDTSKLSDGERQIATIAKALTQQTKVILLDEPTAFLDYANRMSVLKILKQISQEMDVCILQTSHDLESCIEFSDTILVIDSIEKKIIPLKAKTCLKSEIIAIAFR